MTHNIRSAFAQRQVVIKSADEIALMRAAGRINAAALAEVSQRAQPGITTRALDKIAESVIRDHGAEPAFKGYPGPYPYPATINTSINDELVHGIPGNRRLQTGDILSIDCGTRYQGFYADAALTLPIGEIASAALQLLRVTEKALHVGIAQMMPDSRVGDVSAAIQAFVQGHGYHLTRVYTGHGIGQEMHEGPSVPNIGTAGWGMQLRSGMVIALEPMVLVGTEETLIRPDMWTVASADGSLTAHFEHTVAITADGPVILTLQ